MVGWFAHIAQKPDEKLDTAIVARGKMGVGKTTICASLTSMIAARRSSNPAGNTQSSGPVRLLQDVDGRLPWVRRAKDLIALHTADLGGEENCSAAEQALIRRAAVLIVELERLEARFALEGEASDKSLDLYSRMASTLRRLFEAIGLRRRARDVSPPQSLTEIASEYVKHEPMIDADQD